MFLQELLLYFSGISAETSTECCDRNIKIFRFIKAPWQEGIRLSADET